MLAMIPRENRLMGSSSPGRPGLLAVVGVATGCVVVVVVVELLLLLELLDVGVVGAT